MNVTLTDRMLAAADFFDGMRVYFVGGCVRDRLMGQEAKDVDLATPATPEETEAFIRSKGRRAVRIGARFGTIGVKLGGEVVEVTTFRSESYDGHSRKPRFVQWGRDIAEDLTRRDFTINAIAARPDGSIIDPFGGVDDLRNHIVRAVGPPKARFTEDPLRILRAVRFAARFGFAIDPATEKKMNHMRWDLLRLSKERIADEVGKMMRLSFMSAGVAIERMFGLALWQPIFPELHLQYGFDQQNPHHAHKLHHHSIKAMVSVLKHYADAEDKIRRAWAALLHDVAKPFVKTLHKSGTRYNYIDHDRLGAEIARRWMTDYRFSNDDVSFVSESVRDHLHDDHWLRPHDKAAKTVDPEFYLEGGGPHPNLMDGAAE